MLAIVEAYRAGLLKPKNILPNVISGLIVGLVALPLAMAFAIASGVKPEQGIYTSIIAGLCVGIFGGSRVQVAGPTGAFIVILAGITAHYGVAGLQLASFFAGFILLLMGFLKLGNVIKFIPDPVIVGFTSGIGFIIFVGEWKDFFGLSIHIPLDAAFYQKIWLLLKNISHFNFATTCLGLFSLLLILITPKILKRVPGPIVAMLIVTTIQAFFHFNHVATLGSTFGALSQHFPHFEIPKFDLKQILALIGPAFTIALLGSIESLLSATAADGMAGTRHNSNQELIGQGIANIFSPLFAGFAATGAIARTATNIRNGGNSPIAAITHSIVLIGVVLLLAPLAANIPLCTLAAILFVVAYNMSDIPHFIHVLKTAPSYDVIVLVITFLLTVFINLVVAVNIGVILAMLLFLRRTHQSVSVELQSPEMLHQELSVNGFSGVPKDIWVYAIQGPFFFAVAEKIESALTFTSVEPKTVIFRLREMPFIDFTALQTFKELIHRYRHRKINVYICEANQKVKTKLTNAGIPPLLSGQQIFSRLEDVLNLELNSHEKF